MCGSGGSVCVWKKKELVATKVRALASGTPDLSLHDDAGACAAITCSLAPLLPPPILRQQYLSFCCIKVDERVWLYSAES